MKTNNKKNNLIETFIEETLKFNKAHNIVGRHTKEEIHTLDILDCSTTLQYISSANKILDIGSGAGFPGLVIAILQPRSDVTMFEKNQKKAYFIKKTIHTLGLTNAKILNEALTPLTPIQSTFDVITARALSSSLQIIKMSEHLLAKKGKYILMKGTIEKTKEEVAQLDNNTYSYSIHKTNIKGIHRHILEITKK